MTQAIWHSENILMMALNDMVRGSPKSLRIDPLGTMHFSQINPFSICQIYLVLNQKGGTNYWPTLPKSFQWYTLQQKKEEKNP